MKPWAWLVEYDESPDVCLGQAGSLGTVVFGGTAVVQDRKGCSNDRLQARHGPWVLAMRMWREVGMSRR